MGYSLYMPAKGRGALFLEWTGSTTTKLISEISKKTCLLLLSTQSGDVLSNSSCSPSFQKSIPEAGRHDLVITEGATGYGEDLIVRP